MSDYMDALGKEKPKDMDEFRERLIKARIVAEATGNNVMVQVAGATLAAAELGYRYAKEEDSE